MNFYNSAQKNKSNLLVLGFVMLALSSCVKPQNHQVQAGAATFYNDKVEGGSETSAFVQGFSIPSEKLFTFKTCVRDRRTDESLPGSQFKITGGAVEIPVTADSTGCLKWAETVKFDYLTTEKYLPITRTLVGQGFSVGSIELRLAINPWNLSSKSKDLVDLSVTQIPESSKASAEQVEAALNAFSTSTGKQSIPLSIPSLSIENTTGSGQGIVRQLKLAFSPALMMTDMTGQPVTVQLTEASVSLSVQLVESVTVAGVEKKTVISTSEKPVRAAIESGLYRATVPIRVPQGNEASEYFLAVRLAPQNAMKGLKAFEGLFDIGDLSHVTQNGTSTGTLKTSNVDGTYQFDEATGVPAALLSQDASSARGNSVSSTTDGVPMGTTRTNLFEYSMPEASYSGPSSGTETANYRIVKYAVKTCLKDLTNGGRRPVNVDFEVTKADGSKVIATTSSIDGVFTQKGCITWEDQIGHYYYAPEHWTLVPVSIKHKASGEVYKTSYAIAPYERWNFVGDVLARKQFIDEVNQRPAYASRILADAAEFNTMGNYNYEVDDFLSMQMVKRIGIRIPFRVWRPSNILATVNHSPEPLRTGYYMLKAAFVAPIRSVDGTEAKMMVAPMRGLKRIVYVRGGELKAELDFAVPYTQLLNARTYFVFELSVLDEQKLPANDPTLEHSPNLDPEMFVDHVSQVLSPTYVSPLWLKAEKDGSVAWPTSDLAQNLPTTDAVDRIAKLNSPDAQHKSLLEPFGNMNVDRLYAMATAERESYRKRMVEERKLGLFVERANAEYVSLYHENEMLQSDARLKSNNTILKSSPLTSFLKIMNQPMADFGVGQGIDLFTRVQPAPLQTISQKELLQFIHQDAAMTPNMAQHFCAYFMSNVPRSKLNVSQMAQVEGRKGEWVETCMREVQKNGWASAFIVDRRLRPFEVGQVNKLNGRDLDFSLGSDVGFGRSQGVSWGFSAGWGSGGIIGELSKVGLTMGKAAATNPMMKLVTSAPGMLGVGADISRGFRSGVDVHSGFSFGSGKSLHMEQNELQIRIKRYEDCAIVRPRLEFLAKNSKLQMGWMEAIMGKNGSAEALMERGVLICGGFVNNEPVNVTERYYTFGTQVSDTNMNDGRDLSNLPWILSLRGQRDYAYFLMLAGGNRQINPKNILGSELSHEKIDLGDMSLVQLSNAFDRFLQGKVSSIPGYYTREGKIIMSH